MDDEKGMTLTELLVALAIIGLVTSTLVTAIYLIYHVTGWGSDEMRVQHDLRNAATWLNRDVLSASSVHIVSPSQMTLTIPYISSITTDTIYTRVITYTFSITNSTLTRDSGDSTLVVARYINSFVPSPTGTVTSAITITITSRASDVTRSATLHLNMRPEPTPIPTP